MCDGITGYLVVWLMDEINTLGPTDFLSLGLGSYKYKIIQQINNAVIPKYLV